MIEINTFNSDTLGLLRALVNDKLNELKIEGLKFELGRCRYSPTEAKFKLTFTVPQHEDKLSDELFFKAVHFGFKTMETPSYKLIGYNSRRPKYPWTVQEKGGRRLKVTKTWALDIFGKENEYSSMMGKSEESEEKSPECYYGGGPHEGCDEWDS